MRIYGFIYFLYFLKKQTPGQRPGVCFFIDWDISLLAQYLFNQQHFVRDFNFFIVSGRF